MTLLSYLHHQTTPPLRSVVPNSSIAPLPICLAELSSRASHRFVMLNLFQHLLSTSLHKHLFSFLILPIRSRNKFGMTGRKKLSCRTRLSYLSPICYAEFISASLSSAHHHRIYPTELDSCISLLYLLTLLPVFPPKSPDEIPKQVRDDNRGARLQLGIFRMITEGQF